MASRKNKKNKDTVWKQAVETDDEMDILEEWAWHWRSKGQSVGRWRQICEIQEVQRIKDVRDKRDGLLVVNDRKWNLYFFLDDAFSFEVLRSGIEEHSMTAIGRTEPAKDVGHWDNNRWIPHDHLSANNYGFRCHRNFSVLSGYTKYGDGASDKEGRQMTHAWMEITSGRWRSDDGGRHNLELVANMLCEIAGFAFPYPGVFHDEGVVLEVPQKQISAMSQSSGSGIASSSNAIGSGAASKSNKQVNQLLGYPPGLPMKQLATTATTDAFDLCAPRGDMFGPVPAIGGAFNAEETEPKPHALPERLDSGAHVPAELASPAATCSYQTRNAWDATGDAWQATAEAPTQLDLPAVVSTLGPEHAGDADVPAVVSTLPQPLAIGSTLASQHSMEAAVQLSPQADSLAVGSSQADSLAVGSSPTAEDTCESPEERGSSPTAEDTCESPEERRIRLLSIRRSHPTQIHYSKMPDPHQEPIFKWTELDQDNIDRLNTEVPDAALRFDIESLKRRYQKYNGNSCNWLEHMNDCSITARHAIRRVIQNDWSSNRGVRWGGRWRLLYSLAGYAEPWKQIHWRDIRAEYPDSPDPYEDYIKHLCRCFEGEVALAWAVWRWSSSPLPRDKVLWNPQYGINKRGAYALAKLPRGSEGEFDDNVDLLAVGNTTILRTKKNCDGHWHRTGGAISLGDLLAEFGERFTVYELMFWYHNAPKLAKKRPHAWGSQDVRDAAQERKKAWGRYGHWKE